MSQSWNPGEDPTDEPTQRRPLKRLQEDKPAEGLTPLPLAWLLIGALAGLLTVGLLGLGLISVLRKQEPRPPAMVTPPGPGPLALTPELTPIVVQPTAALPISSPTLRPTRTTSPAISTPTGTPTPGVPGKITVGGYVRVQGTGADGLSFRSGPGTNYARYKIVEDGVILLVLQEPREAEGSTWWFLRDQAGVEGWAVQNFLVPSAPPKK